MVDRRAEYRLAALRARHNTGEENQKYQGVLKDDTAVSTGPRLLGEMSRSSSRSVVSFVPLHSQVSNNPDELVAGRSIKKEGGLQLHRSDSHSYITNDYPLEDEGGATSTQNSSPMHHRSEDSGSGSDFDPEREILMMKKLPSRTLRTDNSAFIYDAMKKAIDGKGQDLVFNILKELDIEEIQHIHHRFLASPGAAVGRQQFISALMSGLSRDQTTWLGQRAADQLAEVFHRIDVKDTGTVKWEEFCDFLLFGQSKDKSTSAIEITKYTVMPKLVDHPQDDLIDKVAYMPKLNKFVTCHTNALVSVWTPQGELQRRLSGHQSPVVSACHARGDNESEGFLVASAVDRHLIKWDDTNFIQLERWRRSSAQLCLTYDPKEGMMYSGGSDGRVSFFDVRNPHSSLGYFPDYHGDWVCDALYVPEIASLVTVSLDHTMARWDPDRRDLRAKFVGHRKAVHSVCYSRNHRVLVTGGQERDVLMWNPYMEECLHRASGHEKPVVKVVAVDGTHEIISGDSSGKIKIWDVRKFQCVQTLGGRGTYGFIKPFASFDHDPVRNTIVTVGTRWAFHSSVGEQKRNVTSRFTITHLVFNAAFDSFIVVAGREVTVWQADTGKLVSCFEEITSDEILTVSLNDQGRQVLVADATGMVYLFHFSTGSVIQSFAILLANRKVVAKPCKSHEFLKHTDGQRMDDVCAVYHLGGDHVLVASYSGVVVILDIAITGGERVLYTLRGPNVQEIQSMSFSRPLHMVAAGGGAFLQVWKVDTFSSFHTVNVDAEVTALAFAEGVNTLAAGDNAGYITFYALGTFRPLCKLSLGGNGTYANSIANLHYCDSGRILLSDHRAENSPGLVHAITWSLTALTRRYNEEWGHRSGLAGLDPDKLDVPQSGLAASSNVFVRHSGTKNWHAEGQFPRDAKGDVVVYTNLAPFKMHAWDHSQHAFSRVGMTDGPRVAVMAAEGDGLASLYSPHGRLYGRLLVSGFTEWHMPIRPVLKEEAKEKAPAAFGVGTSSTVAAGGLGSPSLAKLASGYGEFISRQNSYADETFLTRVPSADSESEDSPSVHSDSAESDAPVRMAGQRVHYAKDKERYMGAVCPFFNEIKRVGWTPEPLKPFFYPKRMSADFERNARSQADVHTRHMRDLRQREANQHEVQTLKEWKDYVVSKTITNKNHKNDMTRARRLPVGTGKKQHVNPKIMHAISELNRTNVNFKSGGNAADFMPSRRTREKPNTILAALASDPSAVILANDSKAKGKRVHRGGRAKASGGKKPRLKPLDASVTRSFSRSPPAVNT